MPHPALTSRAAPGRYALLLAALLLFIAVLAPQSAQACVNGPSAGGTVTYETCTEFQDTNGGAGTINVPAGTQLGDLLILTITSSATGLTFTTPTNFTLINGGTNTTNGSNDMSYFVYGWVVNGAAVPATVGLNVSSGNDYLATMMRFSNAAGWDAAEVAMLSAAVQFAPSPSVTTALPDSMILRMGGFDDDDYTNNTRDDAGVMTGHTTISQWETADAGASSAHVYVNQLLAGASGATTFATIPSLSEEYRTVTMGIRPRYCNGTNTIYSSGPVQFEGCADNDAVAATALSLSTPASTAIGDYLLAIVTVDGDVTASLGPPAGWTQVEEATTNGAAATMAVYARLATVAGAQASNFTWTGAQDAYGYIMRFTGTPGYNVLGTAVTGSGTNVQTPSVTTTISDSLVVRLGSFDGADANFVLAPTTIVTGHNNITQERSDGLAADGVTVAAAWTSQATAGASGTANFVAAPSTAQETRRQTLALPPYQLCTGTNATPSGGLIQYGGCIQKTVANATAVTVATPATTAIGDYLLAVVATDGDTTGTIAPPAGWSVVDVGASDGAPDTTLAVYGRFAAVAGTASHTFTWTGAQEAFAYIMRFTGASSVDPSEIAAATGTGTNVSTPAITTAVANTMIVRIGAFDNNRVALNPTTIMSGLNNVTQGRSTADPANSVSSAAAWINQAAIGSSGSVAFASAPTANEQTRRLTLGIRPLAPEFRISHGGSATTCAPVSVTITRDLGNSITDTAYTGTVQLSTDTMLGAWAIGSGSGTLTPGPGDGTASYTFGAGDNGSVTLQFLHATAGSVNINVLDGLVDESASYDASLAVTACNGNPLLFQQVCSDTSNTVNTVNLPADDGNRLVLVTVHRAGGVSGGGDLQDGTMFFDGIAMTKMQEAQINSGNADAQVIMWGMLDAALPVGSGPFTVAAEAIATTGICVLVYQNMDQSALPTAPTDANSTAEDAAGLDTETSVTTALDGALVLSAASARIPGGTRNWSDPPDADLTTRNFSGNSGNLSFGVSSGVIATAGPVTVTEAHDGADSDRRGQVLATLRPLTRTLNHFRITHGGSGGICAPNDVTISAIDQYGDVMTNYTGTITLGAEGVGDWSEITANGTLLNGAADDGVATYQFSALDAGVATLQYSDNVADSARNFDVNAGPITESPFFDANMNLGNCVFRISHAAANGATCAPNSVTIGAYTSGGVLLTGYTGAVSLSAALVPGPGSGGGDWGVGDGLGAFNNGIANDGLATYTFVAGDLGAVTFTYSKTASATVNFNVTATGMSVDGAYDPNLVLTNCFYRISHDGSGDVCTPEAITITVVSSAGVTQTGYVGTVNITTASSVGDWSETTALGTLTNLGFGAATYTFHDDDNGVVALSLVHHSTSAAVNINLNSGSFQEQAGFDPTLAVTGCTIRFSLSSASATTCTNTTVTMGVYNSAGALATSYAGAVDLTTSTNHGTWLSADGAGLVDSNPGNGTGTYTFAGSEGGDVVLVFTSDDVEDLNFNATGNSGALIVDTGSPTYDPDLNITACLPTISDVACYANQNQLNAITLPSASGSQSSRMVLMYVGSTSNTSATGATIEGVAMTLLRTQSQATAAGTRLQVYGILDANLPPAAGDYDAAFTGSANTPAMCIVALEGVAQQFPLEDTPAADGQLNGTSQALADPIITPLTTNANNSIVVGVALNSQGGTTYTSNLASNLWQAGIADPAAADWAGFSDFQLAAGAINVQSDASATPNRQVQIALAIAPFVSGPPAVTGYVPVTLYETFSGNLNYRAIGNTLRTQSNAGDVCAMQPLATGSTATVNLPTGSTITAAYLYWAGSGFEGDADANVTFGVDGSPSNISADEVFIIEPDLPLIPEGFFAAYKNVTGLISTGTSVTYRFSNLSVRQDDVWDTYSTCLGGWSLVVVYENPGELLNVINLFHGFQPFYNSAFSLVPRNFRMAAPDGDMTPHAQVTHITFEGDPDLTGADEVIGLQNDPNVLTFTNLTNPANPANNQYNSSVSYPTYDINLEWDGNYFTSAASYGTDVDTYFVEGALPGDAIYDFGALEAEQITTRYSTSGDYVLLVGEFISVTNAPIADLEVFVTDGGTWKVGSNATSTYTYAVTNNGNGAGGGFASGDVILTGNMPMGITIDGIVAPGWDCALATSTAFTCVLEIATDWTLGLGAAVAGQLAIGENLPNVVVTVDVADDTVFTLLDNDVTTVARLAHVGDYGTCPAEPAGVQPDPKPATGCSKAPQFDNVNDLNKYLIDIDDLDEKTGTNNNVHDNTRNVRGIETNLSMSKSVVGILETNEPAIYQLSVQNLGPDANTKTITVTDTLPSGLVPQTAVGTNWNCVIAGQLVTCTRTNAFPIASGGTAPVIQITTAAIVSPAVEGAFVSNTGTVAIGAGNFDTVAGNNSDTDITEVTGPLAAATEKFLLSVTEDGSTLGGLGFDDGDLVLYDPVLGTATMFLDESAIPATTNLGNVDAIHLLPNGHVILSTATDGATIAGVTFNAEDLVLYDPLLQVATLVFNGSAIFSVDTVNIDSVHVLYNNSYNPVDWDIILSTTDTATIGALTFQDNDIVSYDMSGAVATLLEDGNGADMFGSAAGDISALYLRYDDANKYILSTSDADVTIATAPEQLRYERGELIEIDLTTPGTPLTDSLFCDDQVPCVGGTPAIFTPASLTRRLDAAHVIESGYFGHFAISSAGGDTCSATTIAIRKHVGLSHVTETGYRGSIRISNNLGAGTWAKDVTANGTLITTGYGLGAGEAIYTFAAADNGEVLLYITGTTATNTFNVNLRTNTVGATTVTNENAPTEDPNIVISDLVTLITYADQFSTVAYNNNDGIAGFTSAWAETNDDGSPSTGDIRIMSGQLRFNNFGGGAAPVLMRQIDFSGYTVDALPELSFNYTISGSPSGTFVAEARGSNSDPWTQLWSTTAASGSGSTGALPFTGLTLTATTQIRFRIAAGYSTNASEYMFIDNVQVSTETNDCGVGDEVDHYAITHSGTLVSCQMELITITPHTVGELTVEPGSGTILSLQTSSNKGQWGPPINGGGSFNAPLSNGQATYSYLLGEDAITFPFYYTDLASDPELVTITASDNGVPTNSQLENQMLSVARAGLRFFNDTSGSENFPTLVAGMPSDLYTGEVLTVQAVQTSDNDPGVCQAIFDDGDDVQVELAFECIDPLNCSAASIPVQVTNNGNTVGVEPVNSNGGAGVAGGYVPMTLRFSNFSGGDFGAGTYSGAQLVLNYADAGQMQIHGQYELVVEDDAGNPQLSGDYLQGSGGNNFVVRPFGYDIHLECSEGAPVTDTHYGNSQLYSSWAEDSSGSRFCSAGANIDAIVRAVAWHADDDADVDGNPDAGAVLTAPGNPTTPNYGKEISVSAANMTVNAALNALAMTGGGSTAGALTDATYLDPGANFRNGAWVDGAQLQGIRYSEVGIVDLSAALDSANYLGGGEGVSGNLLEVGRFVPADFELTVPILTERPLFTPATSSFTYMGEDFTTGFNLRARNQDGQTTQNYVGSFAKLNDAAEFTFFAVEDIAMSADIDRSARLSKDSVAFASTWAAGVATVEATLIFNRLPAGTPDGPFPVDPMDPLDEMRIAVTLEDDDDVIDVGRTVDVDACSPDCTLDPEDATPLYNFLGTNIFRYGRIRLENGYGSDISDYWDHDDNTGTPEVPRGQDVPVRVVAEYFNGTQFIPNADDIATPYDSAELGFVPGTFTDALADAEGGNAEPAITAGDGVVYQGMTRATLAQDDAPLYLRAPLIEGNEGTALVELDLDALGLGFLKFDWRDGTGAGEDAEADVKADPDDYSSPDNPRALMEFGQFRGNDRIINWQEIFE